MRSHNAIARWLLACALLVFAMLAIGGITRLTGSGLSIVHWRPVTGALPPITVRDWEELFAQYRTSPQFRLENATMTLEGFKRIFWWEYIHRLVGRGLGVVFAVPFVWFWRKKLIPSTMWPRLGLISALGGAQGVMGWLMVKSGLVDDPRVSPIRLALHLGLAFLLIGALVRTAQEVVDTAPVTSSPQRVKLARGAEALSALVFFMALTGALVAGNHAGLAYNTYPLMAGRVVPPGLFPMSPWYSSAAFDVTTVQFDHRMFALLLACAVGAFWAVTRRANLDARARSWCNAVLAVFVAQFALGVATLLFAVPISLAVLHQANAMALFLTSLGAAHALRHDADAPHTTA